MAWCHGGFSSGGLSKSGSAAPDGIVVRWMLGRRRFVRVLSAHLRGTRGVRGLKPSQTQVRACGRSPDARGRHARQCGLAPERGASALDFVACRPGDAGRVAAERGWHGHGNRWSASRASGGAGHESQASSPVKVQGKRRNAGLLTGAIFRAFRSTGNLGHTPHAVDRLRHRPGAHATHLP